MQFTTEYYQFHYASCTMYTYTYVCFVSFALVNLSKNPISENVPPFRNNVYVTTGNWLYSIFHGWLLNPSTINGCLIFRSLLCVVLWHSFAEVTKPQLCEKKIGKSNKKSRAQCTHATERDNKNEIETGWRRNTHTHREKKRANIL